MATKSKTVEIIFGGVDKTGSAISSVGRNLDSLSGRVGNLTGPLADITDSLVKLDTALAAAAIGVTGYAVKIAGDFDAAFSEIATLIGQPADNLKQFQAQILEYSERSSASLNEITQATYGAISAGVDYKDSLDLIAAAEQLAVAGRADLGETTTALVSTLNAFGAEASQAGAYADDFFTAVQLGQTTIPELSSAIGRLAPIASAAGLDFSEMAAAIATITAETGTSTAETITGIRAAITAMLKPTKQASDLASELGIEFNAAALKSKGFAGVMKDVAEKTGGNTEQIAQLFGSVEALAPVLALTGNAADKFAENLGKFEHNAGAAGGAADQLASDLGRVVQTLQNNLNSALIGYGSRLTDETQNIVKSLTSIFNSLGDEIKLDDGVFAPILDGIEGLAQDIDQKLQAIATNFPEALAGIQFNDLLAAFRDLGDEVGDLFTGLFGDVDLSTVEGLQEVLQKVVDTFTALVNVSAGIADGLEPLIRTIGAGVQEFQDLDENAKKTIGQFLGFGKALDTVLPAVGALGSGLDSIGNGLTALAGAQGFKALIGNLNSVKAVAAGAGRFGLVGLALTGAGAAGYGIGTLINDYVIDPLEKAFGGTIGGWLYEQFNADEIEKIRKQFEPLTEEQKKSAKETRELRELNERLAGALDNTKQAAELDTEALNKRAAELVKNSKEQSKLNSSLDEYSANQSKATSTLNGASDGLEKNKGALDSVGYATRKLLDNNQSLQIGFDEVTGKANSFSGTIIKSGEAVDESAEKTRKAASDTKEYHLELLKMASDEKIATIESTVKLNVAEVEANAEKVKALANTLASDFSSTGDLIGDLFGQVSDRSPGWREVQSQIRKENKRRDDTLEQQKKLTKAEIDYVKAKTKALNHGDALLKVDGAGLQPHLEAFMFEILKAIQVRVNAEGEAMLLGLDK